MENTNPSSFERRIHELESYIRNHIAIPTYLEEDARQEACMYYWSHVGTGDPDPLGDTLQHLESWLRDEVSQPTPMGEKLFCKTPSTQSLFEEWVRRYSERVDLRAAYGQLSKTEQFAIYRKFGFGQADFEEAPECLENDGSLDFEDVERRALEKMRLYLEKIR